MLFALIQGIKYCSVKRCRVCRKAVVKLIVERVPLKIVSLFAIIWSEGLFSMKS